MSNNAEFDQFANDYDALLQKSIGSSGYEASYFDEHKIKTLYNDYSSTNGVSKKLHILNFGCGTGKSEEYINKYFKNCNITSADVSEKALETAKKKNVSFNNIQYVAFTDVEELRNIEVKFDIVFVANVFHHIPEELHLNTLKQLKSMLSDTGFLYVFEHNPKNPLTRKVFETCEFDVGCKMIPPHLFIQMCEQTDYTSIKRKYVLFFPNFVSFLAPLEKYLTWCSLGAQYYIKAN
ncbi:MAG: class I SAM-dependent methyltransferase [Bacteroidia bacterium]